ncbi:MAG: FAD-dependent oxidoreductase [Alphaproteobacteria bacterium]|nr:FAD-dependent oxidoreductase [Rhodospirillales bacterium]MCW9045443.1 FAD-dependent oxidoreductase [Alphaproteobacteria bacterium]
MDYVIIGAGPSGVTAAENLRKSDPTGNITLIGDEPEPPYSRMAIPYFLADENVGEEGTYLRPGDDPYGKQGIKYVQSAVEAVSSKEKTVGLTDGNFIQYDKLLISTGARPIRPPIQGLDLPGVHHCWTLADARKIADLAHEGAHVVLLGAGFIGCIIMESLALRGVKLTVVEMGDRMVPRMMSQTAGTMIARWCESKNITVRTSTKITKIEDGLPPKQTGILSFLGLGKKVPNHQAFSDDTLTVDLDNGELLPAHLIVVAAGVTPNVEFLEGSGIEVDQGILVDEYMATNVEGIYAAGDVAKGRDFSTGGNEVHAIQPTSTEHGRIAALNMAGVEAKYNGSLQMNVLDTIGLISSSFGLWMGVEGGDTVEKTDLENFKYICLQFKDDKLIGASCVGRTDMVGVLRGLIQSEISLGKWKEKLKENPSRVAEAYVSLNR